MFINNLTGGDIQMVFDKLGHNTKRNMLLGVTAIAVAANIPMINSALSGVLNFSIGGFATGATFAGIVGLYTLWLVYNRKI